MIQLTHSLHHSLYVDDLQVVYTGHNLVELLFLGLAAVVAQLNTLLA